MSFRRFISGAISAPLMEQRLRPSGSIVHPPTFQVTAIGSDADVRHQHLRSECHDGAQGVWTAAATNWSRNPRGGGPIT